MATITTHILDTSIGKPAARVEIALTRADGTNVSSGITDDDGRLRTLTPDGVAPGAYCLRFSIGGYFAARGQATFYPHAEIHFIIQDDAQHYHVPLLVQPYGYSTYRGS